ncbi:hypothetical protein F0562_008559 [Nyssa sinensis]|uniref:Uncharacterized protein n=1 Tax=Nyssa sinensis TaxID=561372 RepID=A0A5J5ABE7_9ASTE|nr:hypothetical protein F0562_008559 [Nyssa sinensis]
MLLQNWSFSCACGLLSHNHSFLLYARNRASIIAGGSHSVLSRRKAKHAASPCVCIRLGIDEVAEIAHNKVLIAAAVSAAIGQLSKPFTSAIIYGNKNNFNFRAAFKAGGFPSTHSSAVVATATSLGLERGFSDAIFGLAVVYAGLIMYDAQGVRREVGTHAKALNRVLLKNQLNSISPNDASVLIDSLPGASSSNSEPLLLGEASPFRPKPTNASLLHRSDNRMSQSNALISSTIAADMEGRSEKAASSCTPLNESVGHTVIEVIAGALLGLFVSMAVHTIT